MPLTGAWPLVVAVGKDGVGGRVIQRGRDCAAAVEAMSAANRLSR
jgi:hypothetical protein